MNRAVGVSAAEGHLVLRAVHILRDVLGFHAYEVAQMLGTTQAKADALEMDGTVVDTMRNSQFTVRLDDGHELLAYTGGKMRRFRIRILLGDRVRVEIEPVRPDTRTRQLPLPMSLQQERPSSRSHTISHKVSVSALLAGVSVSLNARPYASYDIVVYSAADDQPAELYAGLRAVGFTPRTSVAHAVGGVRQSFGRDGSALLGGWTGPEREQFIGDARRTLRRFGFAFVPEVPHSQSTPR